MSTGYFGESIELYTKQQAKEYSEKIILDSLKEDVISIIGEDGLSKKVTNTNGNVVYSYIDTFKANKIRLQASNSMSEAINKINDHNDFNRLELPFGYFFSRNIFLSNGIKVPVDLKVVGSHKIEIVSNVLDYGINSSVIEIVLQITVDVQVAIPFQGNSITTISKIPLSIEVINSEVPRYYVSNGQSAIPRLVLGE